MKKLQYVKENVPEGINQNIKFLNFSMLPERNGV